ncbi:multidrug efflux MFS transporter [Imbroritus primus]|uniref:Multidrug efflux MFS transporter n=1 Tax=Imbroritus primus TaxID=3058603 RepID=A0ACD3SRV1_9BURK|nr:multidrug efflux MFS transporter [Burkholderiaceae bacterium PBA]
MIPWQAGPTRESLAARYGERTRWLVLLVLMIGTISSIISSTIVNVAIPDLSRTFVLTQARAQWVSASFMIAMTLGMLLTPWLLLRLGLRRTFIGAVVLLGCGGLVGGLAHSYELVLMMRVTEGLAAGIMQPLPNILILRAFEEREQGRAMSLFGFGVILAPALGPSVGGFLVEAFGWRSIFFVVLPFCVLAAFLARRFMPVNSALMGERQPLDWTGLLLISAATIMLMNGLVEVMHAPALGGGLLAGGALALGAFVFWQLRAVYPLVDMRLFSYRQFAMGAIVSFMYGASLYGSTYLLPVYMQLGLGYTPTHAGLLLLPAGICLAIVIVLAGRLIEIIRPYQQVTLGLALLMASFLLMATNSLATSYIVLVLWVVVGRIGLGLILPSLSIGAMRGVDFSLVSQGSSGISFIRQLGGAIGISVCGIVLQWRLGMQGGEPVSASAVDPVHRLAAFDDTFLFLGVLLGLAMLAAWRMRPAPAPLVGPTDPP